MPYSIRTAAFAGVNGYIREMRAFLVATIAAAAVLATAPLEAVGRSAAATAASQRTLRNALNHALGAAGGASGAYVVDLKTGKPLFSAAARAARVPASVEKLYTTSTALLRFGGGATLSTSVLGQGTLDGGGGWHGTLYLKGGGDPTFGSASFDRSSYGGGATIQRLVSSLVRSEGLTSLHGRVVGDESYFDSVRGTPATGMVFSPYLEGVMSGLAYDRGLADEQGTSYQNHPALFAAQQFASALRAAGVRVPAATGILSGRTPASAGRLATVNSPRLATLIRLTNTPSDNYLAEMLLKGLGARFGGSGSTAAGAAVVRARMSSFGIHPHLDDGSGLSRDDTTSPRQVVTLLRQMAGNHDFVSSLAIAGETGTLQFEMQGTRAQGRCRGKTGTLHDVASLVGYCQARDKHTLAFAFLMNAVDPSTGHASEAQMAVALAQYNG
jgi:D-alanyl-D-alanine carboxypeptidase/D-alanyl-D-alanine-endopeptidase (penicillin-binding protein 4)